MEAALSEFISSVERALAGLPTYTLGVIGTSFKSSSIEFREDLARRVSLETINQLVRDDHSLTGSEIVLLSTCNRIEIYYYGEKSRITRALQKFFKNDSDIYHLVGEEATRHLFEVAAGLDSLVIGETQILSQVKEASKSSADRGLSAEVLSRLFAKAYESARRVREQNEKFSNGLNNSVSHAVLDLISRYFDGKKPNLLLIGSGKMIRLAVGAIQKKHIGTVVLAARRTPLEKLVADSFIGLNDISTAISKNRIDVIITATSSEDYLVRAGHLKDVKRPLLILDISVPRNVDPQVAQIDGVTLLNLDDLKDRIDNPVLGNQTQKVRKELFSGATEFSNWLSDYEEIAPLLSSLRKKAEAIREEELENAFSRLPNLTPNQKLVIEKMSERLIRRFLHDPTIRIKQLSKIEGNEKAKIYAEVITELFSSESSKSNR